MIANLEALLALSDEGTMHAAAVTLRVSQSAVSKRIAVLEHELGKKLITKEGRGVMFTADGLTLLRKIGPILAELKSTLSEESHGTQECLVMGASEAILSSWGAPLLNRINRLMPQILFEVHTHRSPRVVERVHSGNYMLGICSGRPQFSRELIVEPLWEEPMVLIPSGLQPLEFPQKEPLPVIAIEAKSASWEALKKKTFEMGLIPKQTLESSFAVAQMACADFGHGLVPLGVTQALKLPLNKLIPLYKYGLYRPCSMVCRKTTFTQPLIQTFQKHVIDQITELKKNY